MAISFDFDIFRFVQLFNIACSWHTCLCCDNVKLTINLSLIVRETIYTIYSYFLSSLCHVPAQNIIK